MQHKEKEALLKGDCRQSGTRGVMTRGGSDGEGDVEAGGLLF